jgi:hypothetical protein
MASSTAPLATFYPPDRSPFQLEHLPTDALRVGDGFYDGNRRYRIADVWHSIDGSEPFNWGMHVWLEDVSGTSADRLAASEPEYFS